MNNGNNNLPDLEYDNLSSLDYGEYPITKTLLRGVEQGLETGGKFAGEQFKRNILPFLSPEISKSFIEKPIETTKTLAGAYGGVKYPASSLFALLSRKLLETPTGIKATDISQDIVKKIPRSLFGFVEPTIGAIGAAGQIARTTTPEQYREIPRTAVEALAFKAGEKYNEPVRKALFQIPEYIPVPMGKGYKLKRAEQIAQDAEDIKRGIGEQIGKELNKLSPSGGAIQANLYVDTGIDNDIKKILPDNILEKTKDPIYGVKWVRNKLEKTVGNIHRFRQALADQMTGKDWIEATSQIKDNIRQMFMVSGDYMKKTVPELSSLFDEYSGYIKNVYEPATKVLYRGETVAERPIRAAIRQGAEESVQKVFEALSNMSETSKRALSDLEKYAGRMATKRAIGKAAGTVGRAGLWLGTGGGLYGIGRKLKLFGR